MGIMDKLKAGARYIKNAFVGAVKKAVPLPDVPPAIDTSRYLHVSVPLIPVENPMLRKILGCDYMPGKGVTRYVGNNLMKRQADETALALGLNNKQRCKLRSRIKARAAELRAGGTINANVAAAWQVRHGVPVNQL